MQSKIKQYITQVEDGADFVVDVSDRDIVVSGVKVLAIGMYVSTVPARGDMYCDGDLYVAWDMQNCENNGGGDMGQLLMRGDEDEVGRIMGEFYWENAFTAQLRIILRDCGFSDAACNDVSTSEWGMQDEGRASYDAYMLAREVRAAIAQ
jgi:hypothetical protein